MPWRSMCRTRQPSGFFSFSCALVSLLVAILSIASSSAFPVAGEHIRHHHRHNERQITIALFRSRQWFNHLHSRLFHAPVTARLETTAQRTDDGPMSVAAGEESTTSHSILDTAAAKTESNVFNRQESESQSTDKMAENSSSIVQVSDISGATNDSIHAHYANLSVLRDEPLNMTNVSQLQILRNEFRYDGGIVELIEWVFVFFLIAPGTFPAIGCVLLACANAWRRRSGPGASYHLADAAASPEANVQHAGPLTQRLAHTAQPTVQRSKATEGLSVTTQGSL